MRLDFKDGVWLSDDKALLDVERVHSWLTNTYWAKGRSLVEVERSIEGSRSYGVYDPTLGQVAFARAVTDDATYVWIADVYVDPRMRGRGVGQFMVGAIVEQLRGLGIKRFVLATKDAHGVYEKIGFQPLELPGLFMEIDDRPTRPTSVGRDAG